MRLINSHNNTSKLFQIMKKMCNIYILDNEDLMYIHVMHMIFFYMIILALLIKWNLNQ